MGGIGNFLLEAWSDLEKDQIGYEWSAIKLPRRFSKENLLLALDPEQGHHFLIPARPIRYSLNTQSVLSVDSIKHRFDFSDGSSATGRFIDISCTLPMLNDQFDRVIESVFEDFGGESDLAGSAIKTVNSWRRLFSTMATAPELSVQEKYGIFAELSVLHQLVEHFKDFSTVWWTGPSREPHDFELPSISLEIKAITTESKSIKINGFEQLEEKDEKSLFLVLVEIEEDEEGLTVGQKLDLVASQMQEDRALKTRGAALGVFKTNSDTIKLSVTKVAVARVRDDFPRLTRDSLPVEHVQAIPYVSYDLQMTGFADYIEYFELRTLGKMLHGEA